jgi:hypothetical protein
MKEFMSHTEEVMIHFKNGKKRLGIIMEELKDEKAFTFISSSSQYHQERYRHTNIEILYSGLIESIEGDLK